MTNQRNQDNQHPMHKELQKSITEKLDQLTLKDIETVYCIVRCMARDRDKRQ